MITNLLVEHSALVPVVLALVAAVCVGVGWLLLRARRYGQRILWALVVLAMLPVAALTLLPTPGQVFVVCVFQFSMPTLGAVEALANVALFFPLVFFATLATRRPLLTLAAGAVLSAAIEAAQALAPIAGRACDTNDWAMNTIGTVVAVLLAVATLALTRREQPAKTDDAQSQSQERDEA
jgi:hypothetical protein